MQLGCGLKIPHPCCCKFIEVMTMAIVVGRNVVRRLRGFEAPVWSSHVIIGDFVTIGVVSAGSVVSSERYMHRSFVFTAGPSVRRYGFTLG